MALPPHQLHSQVFFHHIIFHFTNYSSDLCVYHLPSLSRQVSACGEPLLWLEIIWNFIVRGYHFSCTYLSLNGLVRTLGFILAPSQGSATTSEWVLLFSSLIVPDISSCSLFLWLDLPFWQRSMSKSLLPFSPYFNQVKQERQRLVTSTTSTANDDNLQCHSAMSPLAMQTSFELGTVLF